MAYITDVSPEYRLYADIMADYNKLIRPKVDSHEKMDVFVAFHIKKIEELVWVISNPLLKITHSIPLRG